MSATFHRPFRSIALVALVFATAACVSQKRYSSLEQQKLDCEAQVAQLDTESNEWRVKYEQQLKKWEELAAPTDINTDAYITDVEGKLQVLREDLKRELPAEALGRVEAQLSGIKETLSSQYQGIQGQFAALGKDLLGTREELVVANQKLEDLKTGSSTISQQIESQRVDKSVLSGQLEDIARFVQEFDEKYFLCKTCPEYLDLRRKNQDTIVAFHGDLQSRLRAVGAN